MKGLVSYKVTLRHRKDNIFAINENLRKICKRIQILIFFNVTNNLYLSNPTPVALHLNVLLRVTFVSSVVFRVSAIKCESPDWLTTVRSRKVVSRGGQPVNNQQPSVLKKGPFLKNCICSSRSLTIFHPPIPRGLEFSTPPNPQGPRHYSLRSLKSNFLNTFGWKILHLRGH